MKQSFIIRTIKVAFFDIIIDVLYFPVWWYSIGLVKAFTSCGNGIKESYHNFAIGILLRNMFKPMYGERSFSGRIISFFARILILLFRLIQFFIWAAVLLALPVLWVGAPVVIIYQIFVYGIAR